MERMAKPLLNVHLGITKQDFACFVYSPYCAKKKALLKIPPLVILYMKNLLRLNAVSEQV